jgi:acyl dehydratase
MPPRIIEGVEELQKLVGQEVAVSDWLTVSQEQIGDFAEATRDRQWIHLDVERARNESPFGRTIAHGFLTLALLSHLHAQTLSVRGNFKMAINYGLNRVRFPAVVPAGARIRGRFVLQALEAIRGGVQLTWAVTVETEGSEKPVMVAEWLVRFYG